MRIIRYIPIALLFFFSCRESKLDTLEKQIRNELSKHKGDFAIAFKDLSSGDQLLINGKESFHAASTMKAPVMIEVFKQASEGKFNLTDSILIKNEFKSIVDGSTFSLDSASDSEFNLYKQVGTKKTIGALMYDMIIVSSNLATNLIIELVDAKNVTQTMRAMGANEIQVLRGVEDSKAFQQKMNNTTTANDLMLIFEKIAREEMVNAEASKAMIKILLDQKFNDVIPAKLPPDVKVAHKTGNITGVQHDCGIVILPNGKKYVLVLLSKNVENLPAAIESMANVSAMVYNYVRGR
jgi:beta-lactamase class A